MCVCACEQELYTGSLSAHLWLLVCEEPVPSSLSTRAPTFMFQQSQGYSLTACQAFPRLCSFACDFLPGWPSSCLSYSSLGVHLAAVLQRGSVFLLTGRHVDLHEEVVTWRVCCSWPYIVLCAHGGCGPYLSSLCFWH